ncbi:hypothetical protein ULMA_18080 [Patiriisocius marinus]|uniref:Glycosyltransferase 2-like domain-containing protein n=1 Tax=Patiriisocius marinus TaxID=1397112 RepID=A0A5J4J130_9FLAO|nr:glycosyltransferase family 2 protein [Patiriisocius marinus]GER59700.1 hypothetical protein ULMA_18080 [Patiriisocius marinus]
MKKISIIIVAYNALRWIERCLDSVGSYDVIVIDNNSKDDTVKFIEINYPSIILLKQKQNLGFGKANNIGITYALSLGADGVFLLNQDAYLYPDTIEKLIKVQGSNPIFGILSPIHYDGDEKCLDENFSSYINYHKNPELIGNAFKNELKDIYEVPFVNAAGWLITKEAINKVGMFDPLFFLYGEDDNLCQRMLFHNFKIGIVPKAFMIHDRENRVKNPIHMFSDEYFTIKENQYKIKFADITNNNFFEELLYNKQKLRKYVLRNLIFLKFNKVVGYTRELRLLKKLERPIDESRKRNINKFNNEF